MRLISFVKNAQWFRLIFFFIFFTFAGIFISFFYNMVGSLYFDFRAKIFFSFVFGLLLMFLLHVLRKHLRIPDNQKLLYTVFGALFVIHFARWSMHITWLRSFDWTVGGLHPIFNFSGFIDYLWYIINEGLLPGMHLAPNMYWVNNTGWLLQINEFELHLRGTLLSLIWMFEFIIISGITVLGVFLIKEIFIYNHCAWARFEKLPYPFLQFLDEEVGRISSGELELITNRPIAEGDVFSQVGLVYAGKTKTEYITFFIATINKKGKAKYKRPARIYSIGTKNIDLLESSLKKTHATFFENNEKTQGIVKGFKPLKKERRQTDGTYKLP